MEVLGVKRGSKYSPNHIGNDDAIFSLTAKALEDKGCTVTICNEIEFLNLQEVKQQFIFTMARRKEAIKKLQLLEVMGKTIINSSFGIENCFRTNVTKDLIRNGIPHPKSAVVSTKNPGVKVFEGLGENGFWLKRGDFHAIHKEDVTFVANEDEGRHIIKEFQLRGIPNVVISENLAGDLVKFYGVRGTDFFFWFYPYNHNHYKYKEYEEINGKSLYYPFDVDELRLLANKASQVVNIHIYGGDAIIGKGGNFQIIDFNDWPSFAPCRDKASDFISDCIFNNFIRKLNASYL